MDAEIIRILHHVKDKTGKEVRVYTDGEDELTALGEFLRGIKNLESVEALPYHNMGRVKYENLGIPYPLDGVEPLGREEADRAKQIILSAM